MLRPAAFLDRDGTLNVDKGYVHKIEQFEWIETAKESIKFLNDKNYLVFVITNQSGIGRGYYADSDVVKLHNYMNQDLKKISAKIDDFFYSPYHPEGIENKYNHLKNLRKPNIGMLELAFCKWNIDKDKSFMIGNMPHDVECGNRFGIQSYLYNNNECSILNLIQQNLNK